MDMNPKRVVAIIGSGLLVAAAILAVVFVNAPKAKAWSGCGVSVHGGHAMGELNGGGPVGLSSTGQLAGVSALCDLAIGQSIVVGGFASAEKAFGDFDTIGINHAWDVGMRAGFLVHPAALLYGHAAFTRMDITTLGNVDGWKWGPGLEIKLPQSAWSFDMRYQISDMDVGKFAPGVDAEVRTVRFGLTYKLGGGKEVESIFAPEVSKPCDKKMANCK